MIHNHHGTTRPDQKMGAETNLRRPEGWKLTSIQNRLLKRRAAKKRRQRDKR